MNVSAKTPSIVATLGPASAAPKIQRDLAQVVDRFRLNASHLDPSSLHRWLSGLTDLFRDIGRDLPVVVDLQGAKMRVGDLAAPLRLDAGQIVALVLAGPESTAGASSSEPSASEASAPEASVPSDDVLITIPTPHGELYAAIQPGERLLLDDARIELLVETVSREVVTPTVGDGAIASVSMASPRITARVFRGGILRSRKSLNRVEHPIPTRDITSRDVAMIDVALRYPFTEFAFSFVHDGHEAALLRPYCFGRRLIAKIERPEAFEHLAAIADGFDEIWLARGDLGAQGGIFRLGALQDRFARAHRQTFSNTPALLAGQVLEHLTHHEEATRAEIVGLHDALVSGYDGVVLSDETAVGHHVDAVTRLLGAWRKSL